jgi:hypothetical protein
MGTGKSFVAFPFFFVLSSIFFVARLSGLPYNYSILKYIKLLLAAAVLFPSLSFAYEAHLNYFSATSTEIKGLHWNSNHVQLETRTVDGHINVFARLSGEFTQAGSKFVILDRVVTPENSNKFDVLVPLVDPHTALTVYSINDFGKPD